MPPTLPKSPYLLTKQRALQQQQQQQSEPLLMSAEAQFKAAEMSSALASM